MTTRLNLRDYLARYLPSWLGDNYPASPSYGYRLLWTMGLFVDATVDVMLQGALAAVGRGTPTALSVLGEARGLLRWQDETDAAYVARLRDWIATNKLRGSDAELLRQVQGYMRSRPTVRIFRRRNGGSITLTNAGELSEYSPTQWNWDSVSHPERNAFGAFPQWSDVWIVVYVNSGGVGAPQFAKRPGTMATIANDGNSFGQLVTAREVDAIKGLIADWKAAHTRVRAVVWTTKSPTEFADPLQDATMPNGTWGAWGMYDESNNYVPSGRDYATCRFWEPR